jgi:hypothetical protein
MKSQYKNNDEKIKKTKERQEATAGWCETILIKKKKTAIQANPGSLVKHTWIWRVAGNASIQFTKIFSTSTKGPRLCWKDTFSLIQIPNATEKKYKNY